MADWPDWRADLFDPHKVPFSRRGSFIAISWLAEDGAFWLRNLRGGDEHTDLGRMLRLQVLSPQGLPIEADWRITPDCLSARTGKGMLHLSFNGPDQISLAANGLGLRLQAGASKYNYAQAAPNHIHVCIATQDLRCDITASTGQISLTAPWNGLSSDAIAIDLLPADGTIAATLDLFRITPGDSLPIPQSAAQTQTAVEFVEFSAQMPQVPAEFAAGRLLACYILWSSYVPAEGALSRPAIYMSKNWMTNIWSWDHCFVALAFAESQPERAFEQMEVIFNAQSPSGRLPDYINDRYPYWSFTKPPVHGWTFAQLRALAPSAYGPERMAKVLVWMEAQVGFWMAGPRLGALPAYRHGNDAGWDNATCFAEGGPLVTPDLATFLILQLDEIAAIHQKFGQMQAAADATARADALCDALCRDLWDGTGFVARHCADGCVMQTGQPLLVFLPLLLGDRLPVEMRAAMLTRLQQPERYLTPHGLATEATDSPLYCANGYWRGPIWAPTTALFVDALQRSGAPALAAEIARRYCTMCTASGMAENHDAQTGAGLHDPAFAWTSAVFLSLGNRLLTSAG